MNTVKWSMRIKRQEKTAKGNILIKALLSGKKKEDGSYDSPLWVDVVIISSGDKATEWTPADLTDKWMTVEGNFSHSDWEAKGKSGKNFTIFASKIYEDDDFIAVDDGEDVPPFIENEKSKAKKKNEKSKAKKKTAKNY